MSSGGGGGQPSQTSQTQTVELPEWARPYAKETLAKTSALTGEDYRPYEGERISGFTPAQTQTQQKIMGMDVAPQMGMASGVTGAAGLASLGAGAQYGQMAAGDIGALRGAGAQYGQMATDPGSMQAYMSPYMQNVVDIQQREAMRQAGIAGTQRGGQAVKAGAFGGSRQAIMEAEAGRNLQQQLGDIQGRGLQTAFEQARQAQQFQSELGMKGTQAALSGIQAGSELGLRGAGQAAQAGQVLGQLGATQFGQEKDILQAQMGVGEQQRAMDQSKLDLGYQDFLRQQQYPYQQLGFMADMIRGIPVGQSATSIYSQPAPSPFSQMAGLAGTAYYGSKIFGGAEGGSVPGYAAGGGISGLNPVERDAALSKPGMDSPQLQGLMGLADISQLAKLQVAEKLQQNAQLRKAAEMAQAGQQPQPQTSVAQEALMEMGLGGLDVPEDMVSAAGGGIMRFAEGPDNEEEQEGVRAKEGDVLTESQREELRTRPGVKFSTVPPQTPTQEEMDEAALIEAQRAGKAPGTDYGRPQYTAGTAPTFTSPYTAEDYMSMREKAMAPGMAQIKQGFADEKAANDALIDEIKKAETQRQADIKAAGEYGAAQEKRAKERLEGIKGRKEDAKLSFIRDVSTTLLTSPTSNFLSDLGLAVGKGGKAYDATVERIDAAKEKLQDSIDTIMEQRRGETIANAKDKRNADAALAKAQNDLAKLLANKKTKFGEMSIGDAKDAVNTATSISMKTAERQHATKLSQYEQQQAAAREAAKPESRDALQARVTTLLASSDPAVRAQGRRLRDSLKEVTDVATYRTAPGQVTPAVDLAARQDIMNEVYREASKRATEFGMSLRKLSPEDKDAAIQAEIDRRYEALMKRRATGAGGAPTGGQGGMSYADAMKK
jgi:hypothetical protein